VKEKTPRCHGPTGYPPLLRQNGAACATRPSRPHKAWPAAELKQCAPLNPVPAVLLGEEVSGMLPTMKNTMIVLAVYDEKAFA